MTIVSILIIHFFALITPGPDFLLVSRVGLSGNKTLIFNVALGVTLGVTVWATISLFGLHVVFKYYPILNTLILLIGALYLIYLAYLIYQESSNELQSTTINGKGYLLRGFITNVSNPKAAIYFLSIFSVLPLGSNIFYTIFILFLISIETILWFTLLGFIFSNRLAKRFYNKHKKKFDITSSFVFMIFSLAILIKITL